MAKKSTGGGTRSAPGGKAAGAGAFAKRIHGGGGGGGGTREAVSRASGKSAGRASLTTQGAKNTVRR